MPPESAYGSRSALLFWAAAAALLLIGLGEPSLRGSEDRFAEITRAMVRTGDYFHPKLNGESHFHKPLLSYWAIAGAGALVGLNELATRLPSALAGLAALAATVALGRTLWSPWVGRLAGWILLSSYGFLLWGRTAAADMENLAAVVLAVAWFRLREHRATTSFYLVFSVICALGAQAKGLAAIVVPMVVLVPHLARYGRWRDHLRPAALALAAALGVVVYVAPFLWSELGRPEGHLIDSAMAGDHRSGLYMVFQENVQRFYAPFDHREGIHTYFVALPILFLPWSIVLVAAILDAFRWRDRLDPDTRWVGWAVGLIFILFSASGSRRSYYILPILPFCALLVASMVGRAPPGRLLAAALEWTSRALFALGAAELAMGLVGVAPSWIAVAPWAAVLSAVTALLGGAACRLWTRREHVRAGLETWLEVPGAAALPVALSVVLLGGYFAFQHPLVDRFRTEKPFALELRRAAATVPSGRVAFLWHVPALYPFYMDVARPIPVLRSEQELESFVHRGPGLVVASPQTRSRAGVGHVSWLAGEPFLSQARYPWDPASQQLGAWRFGRGDDEPAPR